MVIKCLFIVINFVNLFINVLTLWGSRTHERTFVDAHFILSLGAKVNNNKRRVSIIYKEEVRI